MSMFTQKMRMLTAVVMDNDREKVVKALLEKGVMEFVHIGTLGEDAEALGPCLNDSPRGPHGYARKGGDSDEGGSHRPS